MWKKSPWTSTRKARRRFLGPVLYLQPGGVSASDRLQPVARYAPGWPKYNIQEQRTFLIVSRSVQSVLLLGVNTAELLVLIPAPLFALHHKVSASFGFSFSAFSYASISASMLSSCPYATPKLTQSSALDGFKSRAFL